MGDGNTSLLFTIFAIDKATATTGKVGSAVDKLALGIGAAAAGIAIKTTQMAANFQTQMLRLQTSAGEQKSNMATVSSGILDLATKTGDSTKELAAAMYTVESGGQHGAAGLTVLQAAAEGAAAEGADLNEVADATTTILQDYHLKAADAALVTSQMVTAVGDGKTTFQAFASSLSSVMPLASANHIAFSDISGAIAAMTVHGMSADQVTQNLADTIRHLAAPTMAQTKYLGQLGIKAGDLQGMLSTKGLTGTLQYLSTTILTKMGPSGKVLLGTFMQSSTAAENVKTMVASMSPAMQKLAGDFMTGKIGVKDYNTAIGDLDAATSTQMRQFGTLYKRSQAFSDALKSGTPTAVSYTAALRGATGDATGLNTALMLTGENTAYTNKAVADVARTTAEAGGHVKGWAEIQATFNVRMRQAKEEIEVASIKIGTLLLPYMKDLVTWLGASVKWLTKHGTVTRDLAIGLGSLAAAVLLYKTILVAMTVVEKVGIGLGIAKRAVMLGVTAGQWAYNAALGIGNTTMWTWVGVQALDFAAWVRKAAVVVGNTAVLVGYTIATTAVKVATATWAAVQWLLNAALDANPIGLVVLGIAALVAAIIWVATKTHFFQDMWRDTWSFLKAVGAWFAGPFAGFFVKAYHVVVDGLTSAVVWIHSKIEYAKGVLGSVWDTLKSGATAAVLWVHGKIEAVVGFVKSLPARISSASSGMWDGIKNAFRGALDWIIGKWNGLQFSIPSVSFMGIHTPGFTLGVPPIPMLKSGGTAYAGGAVVVGDNGPETMYLPAGAGIVPDGGRGARAAAGSSGQGMTVCVHVVASPAMAQAMAKDIGQHVRTNFGGNVQIALSGHSG